MRVADEILAIYAARGAGAYFGERVSMTEHALQTAYFAQQADAPESLVVAALLHDIGHLLAQVPDDGGSRSTFTPGSANRCACTSRPSAICARPTHSTARN